MHSVYPIIIHAGLLDEQVRKVWKNSHWFELTQKSVSLKEFVLFFNTPHVASASLISLAKRHERLVQGVHGEPAETGARETLLRFSVRSLTTANAVHTPHCASRGKDLVLG